MEAYFHIEKNLIPRKTVQDDASKETQPVLVVRIWLEL